MRLDDEPDFLARTEMQRFTGRKRQVHLEFRPAANHKCGNNDISLLQPPDRSRHNVPRTESPRALGSQQQIAGANADAQARSNFCSNQRRFHFQGAGSNTAGHRAAIFMKGNHGAIENILEPGKVRDRFKPRSAHHFMRAPLRNDPARIQHNDFIAESEDFFAAVCDVENRDPMILVPLPKIGQNVRFGRTVQRGQRLIQQQGARLSHQGTRQRHTLTLTARNLRRPPAAQSQRAFQAIGPRNGRMSV